MAGFWIGKETQEWMNLWLTRALVLLSFAAHLTLALLAGIRRRRDSGVRRFLVWLAYYFTKYGTPFALGKVFLDTANSEQQLKVLGDTATVYSEQQLKELVDIATAYREQLMFAFWAPFLLLHLGRPDNITSYALENKGLSVPRIVGLIVQIGGAIYGSYNQGFMHGDGALRAAFFIMLFFGSYKFAERAVALYRASFANIRCSNEKKGVRRFQQEWDNDDALFQAHGHLSIIMGAFAENEVNSGGYLSSYSGWKEVSKVVEMEASLMYDILYTKASVVHTWAGYTIRVLSPLATSTALYLFHHKLGQAMVSADLVVTYILLVGTLMLDLRWLLRALGSTWTYAFLVDIEEDEEEESKGRHRWLKKAGGRAILAGKQSWYFLRRFLVCLDLSRLSLRSGPSGHRLLPSSGVGQRNLLQAFSTPPPPPRGRLEKLFSLRAGPRKWMMNVKDQLLETYLHYDIDIYYIVKRHPSSELGDYMRSNAKNYSFERNLIAFHVATDIFLLCKHPSPRIEDEASAEYEKQIRALSDYMMFLLAERQHMVLPPGHEASDYKKVCLDLERIWHGRPSSGSQTTREAELAIILLEMYETSVDSGQERNETLMLGADWALKLLHELDPATYDSGRHSATVGIRSKVQSVRRLEDFILVFTDEAREEIKEHRKQLNHLHYMLQLILSSWLRLLSFTSKECSKDSHAKQLSCGGELLTIVWLMNQHHALKIHY
ncbi:unnamed protein product [Triticum turgidum subsp. durum]|uniref:DUF4220 domain-containing protein n=1 Tax=Triticum turgidum subsp. durum TaxID=4567 RepID=A0A9R1BGJ4_TRITD|nr:unnamed protein product [Triticum turgidum subsp. durum]